MGSGAKLEPSAQDLRGHAGEPRAGRGRLASVGLNFGGRSEAKWFAGARGARETASLGCCMGLGTLESAWPKPHLSGSGDFCPLENQGCHGEGAD